MLVAGGGVGVAGRYVQLYIRRSHHLLLPDPTVELLKLHQLHGYNAHALVGITPDVRVWTGREAEGAVAYNEFGRVWLVPGDPLASVENLATVSAEFLQEAHTAGRVVGFMPATERFAKHSKRLGLRAIEIGSAPYFDLATWAPRGDRAKKARAGVNQARRAGVRVTEIVEIDERLVRETACLCKSWLTTRRSALKFEWLLKVDLFRHKDRKKYFAARDANGKLVGFVAASPIPARDGWYLEDVLRSKHAPNGTTDLLVVETLNLLKCDGAKLATLGTAPMAIAGIVDPEVPRSRLLTKAARLTANCVSVFYNFEGVRRFKAKFAPSWWESEYVLISPNVTAPPRILKAFVRAIVPAGPSTLIVRQIDRAWRRMNAARVERAPIKRDSRAYEMQSVAVDGVALNYVTAGRGRPVVLIHGNPGSHQDFTFSLFEKLSQSYHVIAFDRPGHGYSDRPDSLNTTVEVQADLICSALRKLSIEKPVLVGHSWGGSVVLAAAVACGRELAGIVLLAPAAYPNVSVDRWSLLPRVPLLGKFFVRTLTPFLGPAIVRESLKDAFHPDDVSGEYAAQSLKMWMQPERVRAWAYDETTLRASLKVLSRQYTGIDMPAVIVTGADDRVVDPNDHARPLQKAINNSKLIVLPATGHQLPHTRPDAVAAAIDMVWDAASD
ncbi:MAG TPA: alpha/beta fold hydrolase [Pyrinomonadaceae bacterium]|nr:alpha/beta fold hydrolase [Pyrinomonadaceae bacterium]